MVVIVTESRPPTKSTMSTQGKSVERGKHDIVTSYVLYQQFNLPMHQYIAAGMLTADTEQCLLVKYARGTYGVSESNFGGYSLISITVSLLSAVALTSMSVMAFCGYSLASLSFEWQRIYRMARLCHQIERRRRPNSKSTAR